MRTLLTGEFDTATAMSPRADADVKVEVQNGSGTYKDLRSLLGFQWTAIVDWGETVDTKVATATITLVNRIGAANQTLAPLIESSVLNVLDDAVTYSPLIDVGRLIRFSTATVPHGTAPISGDFRAGFTGRISGHSINDQGGLWAGPITLQCSDLGAWLMDLQVESQGKEYGDPDSPPALLTVLQAVIDDWLPAGDPAVTVVKQSSSNFAVTKWTQGETKVMEALQTLVLDSVGEDIRYRFDASHVSTLQWFDPDRSRVTVDATFAKETYILKTLDTAIDDVRNAGSMPYTDVDAGTAGSVTAESASSIAAYRRRYFRLPASTMLTTRAEAQTVIDTVVNDLEAPLAQAQITLPFCWFVQLFDRYTFEANNRQYSDDQTLSVVGYRHHIENSRASTTLTVAGRVVGAFGEWLKRIKQGGASFPPADIARVSSTQATDGISRDFTITLGSRVDTIHLWYRTVPVDVIGDPLDFSETSALEPTYPATLAILPRVAGSEQITFSLAQPPKGSRVAARLVPYTVAAPDPVEGESWPFFLDPSPLPFTYTSSATESSVAGTGTLSVVISDPNASIDSAARLAFYQTVLGVRSLVAATTAPGGSATTGTYTLTFDLDPKHNIKVEPVVTYHDATTEVLGAWTFDSDKRANVVSISQAKAGTVATVTATFDTDVVIGATQARYRVDGGSWSALTVGSDLMVSFTVTLSTTAVQTVEVQGKDSDGNFGPSGTVLLDVYETAGPSLSISVTPGPTAFTITYVAVGTPTVQIDGGSPATPDASPIVVTRDTMDHTYDFLVERGGQTVPGQVLIPALSGTGSGVTASISSVAENTGTASMDVTFTASGTYSTLKLWWRWPVGSPDFDGGTEYLVNIVTAGDSPYAHASADIDPPGTYTIGQPGADEGHVIEYRLVAYNGGGSVLAASSWTSGTFFIPS